MNYLVMNVETERAISGYKDSNGYLWKTSADRQSTSFMGYPIKNHNENYIIFHLYGEDYIIKEYTKIFDEICELYYKTKVIFKSEIVE